MIYETRLSYLIQVIVELQEICWSMLHITVHHTHLGLCQGWTIKYNKWCSCQIVQMMPVSSIKWISVLVYFSYELSLTIAKYFTLGIGHDFFECGYMRLLTINSVLPAKSLRQHSPILEKQAEVRAQKLDHAQLCRGTAAKHILACKKN